MNLRIYDAFYELKEKLYLKKYYTPEGAPNFKKDAIKIKVNDVIFGLRALIADDILSKIDKYEKDNNRYNFMNKSAHTIIDGIEFVSSDEEKLKKLTNYYEACKLASSKYENSKLFLNHLKDRECIITNIPLIYGIKSSSYASIVDNRFPNYVYFGSNAIDNIEVDTFFHELGHFYDKDKNYVKIEKLAKSVKIDKKKVNKFLSELKENSQEVTHLLQDEIYKSKTLDRIIDEEKDKMDLDNMTIFRDFRGEIVVAARNKIFDESGDAPVSDIIQAVYSLKGIHYLKKDFPFGHGKEYYSRKICASAEIFADFSELYVKGKDKILDEFFSKEFRQGLTEIYVSTILGDTKQSKYSNNKINGSKN